MIRANPAENPELAFVKMLKHYPIRTPANQKTCTVAITVLPDFNNNYRQIP